MENGKQARAERRQQSEQDCLLRRKSGGRDHHRCHQKKCEGIAEAAGQVEQPAHLQDVVAKLKAGGALGNSEGRRGVYLQKDVEPCRQRYQKERDADRQGVAKADMDNKQRRGLSANGEPPQPDKRIEAQAPVKQGYIGVRMIGHGTYLERFRTCGKTPGLV